MNLNPLKIKEYYFYQIPGSVTPHFVVLESGLSVVFVLRADCVKTGVFLGVKTSVVSTRLWVVADSVGAVVAMKGTVGIELMQYRLSYFQ